MKIGIIGAGQIGSTLARKFTGIGHEVKIANSRGPATLREIAVQTGAAAVELATAVHDVDLVVIAIPEPNVMQLPKKLFEGVPAETIVVDTGNYFPTLHGLRIDGIEAGSTESGWVSDQIGRPVIKAFNSLSAQSLAERGRPVGAPDRIALSVAGDDPRAKAVVMGLAGSIGFDAIDSGTLEDSWRQQPGSPAFCTDLDVAALPGALATADRAQLPVIRDAAMTKIMEAMKQG